MPLETQYVIVSGDIKIGLSGNMEVGYKCTGPFDSYEAAVDFVEYDLTLVNPQVVPMTAAAY